MNTKQKIKNYIKKHGVDGVNKLQRFIFENSPHKHNPVGNVRWIKIEEVEANSYNPNIVASTELKLLAISIDHDGYTQPVVTIFDDKLKKYIIIDGFHRYFVMKTNKKIREANNGYLPVVVIEKDINDRMASTIRHNRARGKHTINGMGNIIMKMIENGWDDVKVCNELGIEPDELLRLKNMTGVAKLFQGKKFGNAWEEVYQVRSRLEKEKNV